MTIHPAAAPSRRRFLQAVAILPGLGSARWAAAAQFQQITWEALVPADWEPMKSFQDLQHLGDLPDSDPRVQALYERMRQVWDEAPTVRSVEGRGVKIPGFVVPLERGETGLREFLLVPYFGACIHTPPPPANQIIHVRAKAPVRGLRTMSTVWVSGTLSVVRANSALGVSGYRIDDAGVENYRGK